MRVLDGSDVSLRFSMGCWCRLRLLAVCLAACFLRRAASEPCQDQVGEEPVVQFTTEECSCCYDLDEFIQDNDYVYVLFYSAKGRLNVDIGAKFSQLAREWKWTRVHFGRIDVDKDRSMSQKWVDSNMVPTNVMYKFGRPVEVKPKDFEVIRDKYQGSPDGQKWMLTKYMGEDAEGTNLHYAANIMTAKKHNKFLKKHQVAIVGYFRKEGDGEHRTFAETIWRLHQDIDRDDIGAGVGATFAQSVAKAAAVQVPAIAVYLDGRALEPEAALPERWTVQGVLDFIKKFNVLSEAEVPPGASGEL
eukprot:TRINITY_DN1763_c0_g1_i2.p1 TRINITY_DN1763_c0_g1~~TRINITY_DN1763_c0_g1_i2.p1  ORF type:complete len:303 (-),score=59.18 TRINITY_DN1763_c0_g1_i2:134-1042(-)